jgi:hypothetical protein
VATASLLRSRWRPAAVRADFYASTQCPAPNMWVFETRAVSPTSSSTAPITWPPKNLLRKPALPAAPVHGLAVILSLAAPGLPPSVSHDLILHEFGGDSRANRLPPQFPSFIAELKASEKRKHLAVVCHSAKMTMKFGNVVLSHLDREHR